MEIESKGTTTIIRGTESDLNKFIESLTPQFDNYNKSNVIVDLTAFKQIASKDLNLLLTLAKTQKKVKKSFVICADTDYDKVSDKLVVVPTIQEAHDMIEMDEIERDLGF